MNLSGMRQMIFGRPFTSTCPKPHQYVKIPFEADGSALADVEKYDMDLG